MNQPPVLLVEPLDDVVAVLTLNRPDRRNALSIELMQTLCSTFDALAAEPRRRAVLLRGAGTGFCSGLDLNEAADAQLAERGADWIARLFTTVKNSPLVTVAVAHGAAFAGGAGLLACCDFALASDDVQIGFPEVRRGLIPALVAGLLKSRLRDGDLNELFLIAEPISAERALTMGLVHRIVTSDQLFAEALSVVSTVLKGGPLAVRETKRWLNELHGLEGSSWCHQALDAHKRARHGDEALEGLQSFLERRKPNWFA
jgi:methylglutaconyl-CoA hydratase